MIDIVLLFAIAGICSIVLVKLKLPAIFGYLAAGIVLGPTMLPELWVEQATIDMMASFGIVLLMFYIGMELNLRELRRIGSKTLIILTIEMCLIVLIGYTVGIMLGFDPVTSIFFGAIISGSSTAVVVGVLKTFNYLDGPKAKTVIALTVLEDIGQVVILTLAAPLLVGSTPTLGSALSMFVVIVIFIAVSIGLGVILVPRLLNWIGKRYSGETLLIVAVALCFALALASSSIGLSIAIGSFLMGTIVAMSSYSQVIKTKIEPMKELFMAVFFISIGVQVFPGMILQNLPLVLIIAGTFIFAKIFSVAIASYLTDYDIRSSFQIGMGLIAMGEFAFIIAKVALDAGLVGLDFYSSVIGAALITMFILPLLSRHSSAILDKAARAVPASARGAFGKIEELKMGTRRRFEATSEVRKRLRSELLVIVVDIAVIVGVQLLVNFFLVMGPPAGNPISGVQVVPLLVVYLLGLVLITPAVFNTIDGIRKIAAAITYDPGNHEEVGARRFTYGLIKNIGYIILGEVLILLFIPFMSVMGEGLLTTLVFLFMSWLVIISFIWRNYKSTYDKVSKAISKNVLNDEGEEA